MAAQKRIVVKKRTVTRRWHGYGFLPGYRPPEVVALVAAYAKAQGMYRTKSTPDPIFTDVLKLELSQVEPSLAGPKRPQDRVALGEARRRLETGLAQAHRDLHRLVQHDGVVVLFHHRRDRADHGNGLVRLRLTNIDSLETAGQRRILFEVLAVFGIGCGGDRAQVAAGEGRFEQVGGIAGACLAARTDQGMRLVDKQDDWRGAGFHLVDYSAQALFKFALHARTGLHQANIETAQRYALQRWRHIAIDDAVDEVMGLAGLVQKGLKASRKGAVTLGNYQEVRIRHCERAHETPIAHARPGVEVDRRIAEEILHFGKAAAEANEHWRALIDEAAAHGVRQGQPHDERPVADGRRDEQVRGAEPRIVDSADARIPVAWHGLDKAQRLDDRGGVARADGEPGHAVSEGAGAIGARAEMNLPRR